MTPQYNFFQPLIVKMSFKPIEAKCRPKRPYNFCASCKSDTIHEAQLECSCPYMNSSDSEEDDFVKVSRLEPETRQPLNDPPDRVEDVTSFELAASLNASGGEASSQEDHFSEKEVLTQVTEKWSQSSDQQDSEEDLTQEVNAERSVELKE